MTKRRDPAPTEKRPTTHDERVKAEVTRVIVEVVDCDPNDVLPQAKLIEDLGADSLALVEMVLGVEEAFELEIPDEDVVGIETVQQAIDYVTNRTEPPGTRLELGDGMLARFESGGGRWSVTVLTRQPDGTVTNCIVLTDRVFTELAAFVDERRRAT